MLKKNILKDLRKQIIEALDTDFIRNNSDYTISPVNDTSATFTLEFKAKLLVDTTAAEVAEKIRTILSKTFTTGVTSEMLPEGSANSGLVIDVSGLYSTLTTTSIDSKKKSTSVSETASASSPVDEQPVVIHEVALLTDEMLARHIGDDGKTLGSFLADDCEVIAKGERHCIYKTSVRNYFRLIPGNRPIRETHVTDLMHSYHKDGYLFTIVYVNEFLEEIDAQHRLEAAIREELPVFFMIMPGWGIREVTVLNVNSQNWSMTDFLEMYAKRGNENYQLFKDFYDEHEYDISTVQILLFGKRLGKVGGIDEFREGLMKLSAEQVEQARARALMINEFKLFHPLGWKSRNFVEALLIIFALKGYVHTEMINQMTLYPDMVLRGAMSLRREEYIKLLLERYNFKKVKNFIKLP